MNLRMLILIAGVQLASPQSLLADFTTFHSWTLVQDLPNANFSAQVTPVNATLSAGTGAVAPSVDIGLQSINAKTPNSASTGYKFDATSDFSIGIDYTWAFDGTPTGILGLGFGVGEDGDGRNSAGVAMLTQNGSALGPYVGAARIDDVTQSALVLDLLTASTLSGSLFVEYRAHSGDVLLGAATMPGAGAPQITATYAGIQKQWTDSDLIASFFLRSDLTGWQGVGTADVTLSNVRVLSGGPIAVPEPSSTFALMMVLGLTLRFTRPRKLHCAIAIV